ncbi:MAG: heparinase II/III family protein, partial [Planctomycetaceae bacterium]|nr:heparinase II/III family protein [Planctomycetaceae bacterium]
MRHAVKQLLPLLFLLLSAVLAAQDRTLQIDQRAAEILPFMHKTAFCVGRPITDRNAWQNVPNAEAAIKHAEQTAAAAIPAISESLYKEYHRIGNRRNYERVWFLKTGRISALALGECLENKGRFIAPLEETIKSICGDPSWVLPAHDSNAAVYDRKTERIDLFSAHTSAELGLAVYYLGDKLSPDVRKLILDNVQRRTFKEYEDDIKSNRKLKHWWITGANNWNAVCHCGVVTAAQCLIDDPQRRAWYIASAEKFMKPFLDGFTPDGYCSEGMGYWNYGFGNFILLTEVVRRATDGQVDFLTMPKASAAAAFPMKMEVAPGQFAAFADCSINAQPSGQYIKYLSRRLHFGYKKYETLPPAGGYLFGTGVFCFENSIADKEPVPSDTAASGTLPVEELRSEFPDAGVLICRPKWGAKNQLAFVCKAGHNNEHHNHNDVGSFTVMFAGKTPVLDPGGEVYTSRTFSNKRYNSNLLNSFGHPVPVVNGQMQKAGGQYSGKIVTKTFSDAQDLYVMDISAAYGQKEIEKLQRTFSFTRTDSGQENSLTITDEVKLTAAGAFETALISCSRYSVKESETEIELTVGEGEKAVKITVSAVQNGKPLPLRFVTQKIEEDAS